MACTKCDKRFIQPTALKIHLKTHLETHPETHPKTVDVVDAVDAVDAKLDGDKVEEL